MLNYFCTMIRLVITQITMILDVDVFRSTKPKTNRSSVKMLSTLEIADKKLIKNET